jgi:hypothetical protein
MPRYGEESTGSGRGADELPDAKLLIALSNLANLLQSWLAIREIATNHRAIAFE